MDEQGRETAPRDRGPAAPAEPGAAPGPRRRTVLATTLGAVPVAAALGGVPSAASAAASTGQRGRGGELSVGRLTVEHRVDPLGVDARRPRFGWQSHSTTRGQRQTAYRIRVATSRERLSAGRADVWDSGRVSSARSVAVPYAGSPLRPSTPYVWRVEIWDKDGRRAAAGPVATFETGLLSEDGTTGWNGASWITMKGKKPNTAGAPLLRAEKTLRRSGRGVTRARLYASALGVYDAYLNGERVGVTQDGTATTELLAPGWTNYEATVNYLTYDVTDLVAGRRTVTLGAVLGNGWYNGRISAGGFGGTLSKYYSETGNPLAFKAKLLVEYGDGGSDVLVTAPGQGWKATDTGPWRADDIYDGETYDAREEITGWASAGHDTGSWAEVETHGFTRQFPASRLVAYPGDTARIVPGWDRRPRSVAVHTGVTGETSSGNGKGRVVLDKTRTVTDPERAARARTVLRPGETAVFDFGQNQVGVPRYTLKGPAGAEVVLRFGEMLNDDSEGADGPEGSVYLANLRTAKATSTYILNGDRHGETHQDSLTFYGYRYVSVTVTSAPAGVEISGLTARVATSALREAGDLTTDNDKINQLFSNIRWGQRGNYLWIPTDCPQRDERLGWTGDTQLFCATGLYNADATAFLEQFQAILLDSQISYGVDGKQFTGVAPGTRYLAPLPQSGWADAGVIIPWTLWQMSGDTTVIDRSWTAMTGYLDWIREKGDGSYAGQGSVYGDWLAFQPTSAQLTSDVYFAHSTRLMADMARATGRTAPAQEYDALFQRIKRAYITKYLGTDADGHLVLRSGLGPVGGFEGGGPAEDNTQTALLWTLKLGLYDTTAQRRALVGLLAENIENSDAYKRAHPDSTRVDHAPYTLSVGFLGVNVLAPVLTEEGRPDLAYRLLHQNATPSWLYSVDNGATTVWERWNSYSREDGFGEVSMNSFNHYSYGAIAEWMYSTMAGIAADPDHPGFKRFLLRPVIDPTGKITRVSGTHESPYGKITSEWSVRAQTLVYRAQVPANTTATLRLPARGANEVREGHRPLAESPGVKHLGFADGVASYQLPAGTYEITSRLG
ncbi:family 78 glycoside hydrolase catalytic domain [Streptomyces ziwulingensis]|uniref:alpha-L-rhamnosidase n=1 Tax=Streptomyces ziwulingensis TaxID=1045501 RepID=A0ABP9CM23_9ACTN